MPCGICVAGSLFGLRFLHHLSGQNCAHSSCRICTINRLNPIFYPEISGVFVGVLTAFTVLPGVSERSIHLQLPTMRSQISTDDGWDLIPFESAAHFVQPTAKATPLSRPEFVLQPRLPVSLRVSMSDMPALPRPPVSGPKFTVANLSDAVPRGIPQFSPVVTPCFT